MLGVKSLTHAQCVTETSTEQGAAVSTRKNKLTLKLSR